MYEFNPKTSKYVEDLLNGEKITIGGEELNALSITDQKILKVIVENFEALLKITGAELVSVFMPLYEKINKNTEEVSHSTIKKDKILPPVFVSKHYKIGKIRTNSFRGIAPSGVDWEYDFNEKSHLIHGPNGSGKSSLLGSIAWCLTGKIFRDGSVPSAPSLVRTFTTVGEIKTACNRYDSLSLVDLNGENTKNDQEFWVMIELLSPIKDDNVWIKRSSISGLSYSKDCQSWLSFSNFLDLGIDPLNAEINIVMPARVPHINFGKDSDLFHLFSQIIGLDDLEKISNIANKLQAGLNREVTSLEKKELSESVASIGKVVTRLKEDSNEEVGSSELFKGVLLSSRNSEKTFALLNEVNNALEAASEQMAKDLNISLPDKTDPAYPHIKKKLENLPGEVKKIVEAIDQKEIEEFFTGSLQKVMSSELVAIAEEKINNFIKKAITQIQEKINFAEDEKNNPKLSLFFKALDFFNESNNSCPLCEQDLTKALNIKEQLLLLKPKKDMDYLLKSLADLTLGLLAELNTIVSADERKLGNEKLKDLINSDWTKFQKYYFSELLLPIASRFTENVDVCAKSILVEKVTPVKLLSIHNDEIYKAIQKLEDGINLALAYLGISKDIQSNKAIIEKNFQIILGKIQIQNMDSIKSILIRGKTASDNVKSINLIKNDVQNLDLLQKKHEGILRKINTNKLVSSYCVEIKKLELCVRKEIALTVSEVQDETINNYKALYKDSVFDLSLVTAGHAADPNIKEELNIYFKKGLENIPVFHFSNAGRIRGLAMSFVFALIKKSNSSLDFFIFDDPATSFDDEHKVRFINKFIRPMLVKKQIILATHYEDFYKKAAHFFSEDENLLLVPKKIMADKISFEPGDLLKRVTDALHSGTLSWKECAINQRKWIERLLNTLNAYNKVPFYFGDQYSAAIERYSKLTDVDSASARKEISEILNVAFIKDLQRNAHEDESVTKSEIEDKQEELLKCKKVADKEIRRLKSIYKHTLMEMGIDSTSKNNLLQFSIRHPNTSVEIISRAAAARDGQGTGYEEFVKVEIENYPLALANYLSLDPLVKKGQLLLLDPNEETPKNADLVIFKDDQNKKYMRRFWESDGFIQLEAINSTESISPVVYKKSQGSSRKICGILFDGGTLSTNSIEGNEWSMFQTTKDIIGHYKGIRVEGTSLDPIAKNGQIVLIDSSDGQHFNNGDLALFVVNRGIDTENILKRYYLKDNQYILTSINSHIVEHPLVFSKNEISKIYKIKGVLFETGIESV